MFHTEHPQLLGATVENLIAGWPGTRDLCTNGARTQFAKYLVILYSDLI